MKSINDISIEITFTEFLKKHFNSYCNEYIGNDSLKFLNLFHIYGNTYENLLYIGSADDKGFFINLSIFNHYKKMEYHDYSIGQFFCMKPLSELSKNKYIDFGYDSSILKELMYGKH